MGTADVGEFSFSIRAGQTVGQHPLGAVDRIRQSDVVALGTEITGGMANYLVGPRTPPIRSARG